MKAAVYTAYGPPEVVRVTEIARPVPAAHEVLVRVVAATVNRTDAGFRSAEYVISRFWSGLWKPKIQVLGSDFAGVVASVGKDVTMFNVGDRVFGYNDQTFGGHGEYLTIAEAGAVATMPASMSFEQGAALTEGAHYALCQLRAARVTPGQQVLVYGATGAIGAAAVQLLKAAGATVTAVCNTKNVDLLKTLGADQVIDYQTQDFTAVATRFDFVLDAVGKSSFGACKPLLTAKGIYISTELGQRAENVFLALTTPLGGGKRVLFPIPTSSKADVLYLRDLFEKGAFTPVIDRRYPLSEIVAAYRYVGTGQKTGNVILQVAA